MARKDHVRKEIDELFRKAADAEQELADRYVQKARKLALKHRISMRPYNRVHCRKCGTYFTGETVRVRTRPGTVVYTCRNCGHMTRIPRATHRSS